ncbi:response regulator receiver domain protein [Leptospira ryugenii]|uniref:Response regulator receiver domain protein n=1 Tax=Leptospira ryugenii TaxID=1917863 RepID=A0A2P2E194_9LEPT|nr:response regulator [Leptospira ryugenii]GBF50642.1 response regulator receiver domain protein [Leptospira ryugenii]
MDFDEFMALAIKEDEEKKEKGNQVTSQSNPNGRRYHIVLVDDLRNISASMKREILLAAKSSDLSVYVWEFQDPEVALQKIPKIKPDLLITDIKMPYLTGDKLVETVKKQMPDLPVIVVTGFATKENILSVYRSDKNSIVLSKPWESKRLMDTIAGLIGAPLEWPIEVEAKK